MRVDKFLKTALLFKTRSGGEKAIEEGAVFINDKQVKPASTIKEGDLLKIKSIDRTIIYRVLLLLEKNVSKQEAKEMVELVSEEKSDF